MKINNDNISFLLQGRISLDETGESLKSIFVLFDNPIVVVATWSNLRDVGDLLKINFPSVKFLFLDDPGSEYRKLDPPTLHNVNRIIYSSKIGLDYISSDYVFKIRADIKILNKNFINLYIKYYYIDNKSSDTPFKERILISNQTTIDPKRGPKLLYHPCDWVAFGLTKDIKLYFDIDFMCHQDHYWYKYNLKPENKIDTDNFSKYMAEDYIGYTSLRRFYNIQHDFYCDYSDAEIKKWESILGTIYIVASNDEIGIMNLKYKNIHDFHLFKSYTFIRWKRISSNSVSVIEEVLDRIKYQKRRFLFFIWKIIHSTKELIKIYV